MACRAERCRAGSAGAGVRPPRESPLLLIAITRAPRIASNAGVDERGECDRSKEATSDESSTRTNDAATPARPAAERPRARPDQPARRTGARTSRRDPVPRRPWRKAGPNTTAAKTTGRIETVISTFEFTRTGGARPASRRAPRGALQTAQRLRRTTEPCRAQGHAAKRRPSRSDEADAEDRDRLRSIASRPDSERKLAQSSCLSPKRGIRSLLAVIPSPERSRDAPLEDSGAGSALPFARLPRRSRRRTAGGGKPPEVLVFPQRPTSLR